VGEGGASLVWPRSLAEVEGRGVMPQPCCHVSPGARARALTASTSPSLRPHEGGASLRVPHFLFRYPTFPFLLPFPMRVQCCWYTSGCCAVGTHAAWG